MIKGSVYYIFVNTVEFMMTVSRNIKFVTAESILSSRQGVNLSSTKQIYNI